MRTLSSPSQPSPTLARLRAQIRALERPAPHGRGVLPFGIAPIDTSLAGGLALGALHEVRGGADDTAGATATLFAASLLARLKGPVLWCHVAADLFPPALAGVGLLPDRVIHAAVGDEKTVLLVMEEGLARPGLGGVIGELFRLPMLASRRLALAAEKSGVFALVLRRGGGKAKVAPIAARTRWRVSPFPAPHAAPESLPRALWRLELIRGRGARAAAWLVEAPDAAGRLALAAVLPDRSTAPRGEGRLRA